MALTDEQRAQAAALAKELGEPVDEVIAELEELATKEPAGDRATPAPTKAGAPAGEIKIFAYHLPFMKVGELRGTIGLKPDGVPDSELPTGQWLKKYGGGETAAPAETTTPAGAGGETTDG